MVSLCFRRDGKIEDFIELLVLSQMKFDKMCEFSLIILAAISEYLHALFSFTRFILLSIYSKLMSLKL